MYLLSYRSDINEEEARHGTATTRKYMRSYFFPAISYLLDRILSEFCLFVYIYIYMFSHAEDREDEEDEVLLCFINVHLVVAEQKDA